MEKNRSSLTSASPADIANWVIANFFTDSATRLLYCDGADLFYYHPSGQWTVKDPGWLTNELWRILSDAVYEVKTPDGTRSRRVCPTKSLIENVVSAISAFCQVDASTLPKWLNYSNNADPRFLIEFKDCILDIKASAAKSQYVVLEKNQNLLNTSVLSVPFSPDALCPLWDDLSLQWGCGDPTWVECRNRCYGYALLPFRGYAKWLLEYGKPRSGKGTATNAVLSSLLSTPNIYFTKVRNLADTFGLDGPDKSQVLVIGEADELTTPSEGRAIVSILKSAVGGDPVPIRIMYTRGQQNRVLRCFPIMQCNEMPHLPDSAQGLMSKMIPLYFGKSFAKSQDHTIPSRLQHELPGIARCWVDAAIRLVASSGNFSIPSTSTDVLHSYNLANNPVEAFLSEYFIEDPTGFVPADEIRACRKRWEAETGMRIKRSDGNRISDQHLLASLVERTAWDIHRDRRSYRNASNKITAVRGLTGLSRITLA
jgi:hypothetical protein